MSFENPLPRQEKKTYSAETTRLAKMFAELNKENFEDSSVFTDLENDLAENGFYLAKDINLVSQIFNDSSLLCRSEKFSRVMDLLIEGESISLTNSNNEANMCHIASGDGFRIAMTEGFSGKDVNSTIKTVVTFKANHLNSTEQIQSDSSLWQTKLETARVSVVGKGNIEIDDIEMISFRIPVHLFPEHLLNETERDRIEDAGIKFITRHYLPNKKTTH